MKYRQSGFTLIEILLVVLIMGIAASAITLSVGGHDKQQALNRLARQFIGATELVIDESTLSGRFNGIIIDQKGYKFTVYDDGEWSPLVKDRLLSGKKMKNGVQLELVLGGLPLDQQDEDEDSLFDEPATEIDKKDSKKPPEPQILLFPSGEVSAFELSFVARDDRGNQVEAIVVGDALGRLTLGGKDDVEHDH